MGAETLAQLDLILAGVRADGPPPTGPAEPGPPIWDITYNDTFVRNGQAHVSFTFDDGPDPDTAVLLDLLRDLGLTGCTFFCQGQNVQAHPALARRIGCGAHDCQPYLGSPNLKPQGRDLNAAAIRSQIQRTQDVIADVTGLRRPSSAPPMER